MNQSGTKKLFNYTLVEDSDYVDVDIENGECNKPTLLLVRNRFSHTIQSRKLKNNLTLEDMLVVLLVEVNEEDLFNG